MDSCYEARGTVDETGGRGWGTFAGAVLLGVGQGPFGSGTNPQVVMIETFSTGTPYIISWWGIDTTVGSPDGAGVWTFDPADLIDGHDWLAEGPVADHLGRIWLMDWDSGAAVMWLKCFAYNGIPGGAGAPSYVNQIGTTIDYAPGYAGAYPIMGFNPYDQSLYIVPKFPTVDGIDISADILRVPIPDDLGTFTTPLTDLGIYSFRSDGPGGSGAGAAPGNFAFGCHNVWLPLNGAWFSGNAMLLLPSGLGDGNIYNPFYNGDSSLGTDTSVAIPFDAHSVLTLNRAGGAPNSGFLFADTGGEDTVGAGPGTAFRDSFCDLSFIGSHVAPNGSLDRSQTRAVGTQHLAAVLLPGAGSTIQLWSHRMSCIGNQVAVFG